MKRKSLAGCTAVAIMASALFLSTRSHAGDTLTSPDALKNYLWQKELKIYEGRSHGNLDYYLANTSPHFLAWPPVTDRPIGNEGLKKTVKNVVGGKEVITGEVTGFSQDGDTAVIYYLNHRTRKADGTPVDEKFANIHVWIKRNADWVLLGGLSRQLPPGK
jgi:hypothetical protein